MPSQRQLQQEYVDEKIVRLADHLYERVTTDADPFVDDLLERLQPQLDGITTRLQNIHGELAAISDRLDTIEQAIDTGDAEMPVGYIAAVLQSFLQHHQHQ